MAVLGNFLLVTGISGSVAGNVFSATNSGPIIRARVVPHNPRSADQLIVRNALAAASAIVHAQAPDVSLLWKAYVAGITKHNKTSGAAYHPTIINALNALYVPYLLANQGDGSGFPVDPPSGNPVFTPAMVAVTSPSDGEATFTATNVNDPDSTTFIRAHELLNQNAKVPSSVPKIYDVFTFTTMAPADTITGLASGHWYQFYEQQVNMLTGQENPYVTSGGPVLIT